MGLKVKGEKLMVFMGGKSIAYATNHTLTVGSETIDTSNKDEGAGGFASAEVGRLNWTMTTENLYSEDGEGNNFADLYDAMVNRTVLTVVFGHPLQSGSDVPTGGWTPGGGGIPPVIGMNRYDGSAVLTDLQLTAQNGQYATFSATFQGVGALTLRGASPLVPSSNTSGDVGDGNGEQGGDGENDGETTPNVGG